MSSESVMLPTQLILCHPFLLLCSVFPSIRVFSNESALHIRWPKYWCFSFSKSPSNEYSGLIFFRMNWLDLLVQGTLKSLLQHHSSKASILWCSDFFMVQLPHPYMTTEKNHSFDDTDCVHVCILSPPWGLSQLSTQSESVTLSIRARPSAAHSGFTASRLIQSRSQRHQGSAVVSSHLAPLPTWSPVAPSPLGSDPATLILHQNFALNKFLLWKTFPQSSFVFHSLNTFLSLFKCHLLSGSFSHSI